MNNLAVERRDFLNSPLPLTPEFIRNIRLLGRRPTAQLITDNLIKKYGTHFLLSATLGGRNLCFFFCDKSSWWFSKKVIIPTVSKLEFFWVCFFSPLKETNRSHAYLHLNFHSIKPRKITCDMLCLPLTYNILLLPLCARKREAGANRWHHGQNRLPFRNPHTLFRSVLQLAAAYAYKLLHVMQQYWLYTTDVAFTALENKQYCVRLEHKNGDACHGFAAEIWLEYKLPHRVSEHLQCRHTI